MTGKPLTIAIAQMNPVLGDLRGNRDLILRAWKRAAECGADLVIEGSLRSLGNATEATIWLVDGRAGRVLRSRRIRGNTASQVAAIAAAWLAEPNNDSAQ